MLAGPIIRINPNEVHIDDPEYYDTIYSHNLQLDKLESFNHRWNAPGSVQVTGPHALHKVRCTAINPFFSKCQIVLLWPYILSKAEKLCTSLQDIADTRTVFLLTRAFGCFPLDAITEYGFGNCFNALNNPEISPPLVGIVEHLMEQVHVVTHIPLLLAFTNASPAWLQKLSNQDY